MKPFVFEHILAPTDLSESSLPALRYARLLAARFASKLTVLYVDPILYPVDYLGPTGPYGSTPEHEAHLKRELEKYAATTMEGQSHEIVSTIGQPVGAILAEARDRKADLIVVGTHLRHGWRRALLGSVSDGVLHGADCPVLTVAKDDSTAGVKPYAITNILCPVNFTDVARESLQVAAKMADAFGARLTIVHVLETDELTNLEADEERVRQWVAPELQQICSFRELVLRGGPAERVLDCAEDLQADFLVIGAQHKLFRDATVIGTTTERLIRFASCPVLVVPRPATRQQTKAEPALTAGATR